jgi:hypothetical protein
VTIGSGSYNITARDIFCANSHGMSIGSLGSNGAIADVQNILFENIFIVRVFVVLHAEVLLMYRIEKLAVCGQV